MDIHATDYFSTSIEPEPQGHFHQVIALHDNPLLDWREATKMSPELTRGWYELAQLSTPDRINFIHEFWEKTLPYHPNIDDFLNNFFASIDDLGVFLTQQSYEDPFVPHMVYSLLNNGGFFHGERGATEAEIIRLQKDFARDILPPDYLAFLQIHNGFAKLTDTGVISSTRMKENYLAFQALLKEGEGPITTHSGTNINPSSLIPFYESFGMPFYQCFWKDWYPDQEMGNVYYSALTRSITTSDKEEDSAENMAFQNFTDWLMFYLEKIE